MGEQKMTARHLLVALTCIVGIFTTSAITFSCPGLCYKPVANYLGLQVSDVSFYMSVVYFAEVVFSPIVGALLEKFDVSSVVSLFSVHLADSSQCLSSPLFGSGTSLAYSWALLKSPFSGWLQLAYSVAGSRKSSVSSLVCPTL